MTENQQTVLETALVVGGAIFVAHCAVSVFKTIRKNSKIRKAANEANETN